MAKVNPPRRKGHKASPSVPTEPRSFRPIQFWRDMTDAEYARHLGGAKWNTNFGWSFVLLFFSLLALIVVGSQLGETAFWYEWLLFGASLIGLFTSIIWIAKTR